jgi:CheY-like chemotaxis protein
VAAANDDGIAHGERTLIDFTGFRAYPEGMGSTFCPACGVVVEPVVMTIGSGVSAEEQPRCPHCGYILTPGAQAPAAPVPAAKGVLFPRVALAEDMDQVRQAVKEDLLRYGMATVVDEFADGAKLLTGYQTAAQKGARPYDLAILDLNMPIMDGLKAAGFIRAMERQLLWRPTPVLFFSAAVCDDRLRQQFTQLTPAFYVNKGSVKARTELAGRLWAVLTQIKG